MKHGSLFSGIGGFDLAAEWMGWENAFHCEIAEFPRKVLHYYWPNAISYENIKETDFTQWRGKVDVISGGFPCQPYSLAGKRLGKEDDRHLWPEMLRCIREIKPRWVVGENVLGIVNWNGGLVFNEVQADLEAEGYEVQAFVLPAAGVGAPHRRDRVWFVAYANDPRRSAGFGKIQDTDGEVSERHDNAELGNAGDGVAAYTAGEQSKRMRFEQPKVSKQEQGQFRGTNSFFGSIGREYRWDNWPTAEPTIRRGDDGISERLGSISFSKWRNESIKAYGNAVVPQVVFEIFKAIEAYELKDKG